MIITLSIFRQGKIKIIEKAQCTLVHEHFEIILTPPWRKRRHVKLNFVVVEHIDGTRFC